MKYVIETDLSKNDCSFCPGFDIAFGEHRGHCLLSGEDSEGDTCFHDVAGVLRESDYGDWKVWCYDRPDWCPLVSFETAMEREWVESVNSQPSKDESKEIILVELYESELDKLGGLAMVNKLSTAQMIAKLIDDCNVAKPYINHGDHGPEPRFDGDAWTCWYCCGKCDRPINYGDNYCSSCGAKIDWSDNGRA